MLTFRHLVSKRGKYTYIDGEDFRTKTIKGKADETKLAATMELPHNKRSSETGFSESQFLECAKGHCNCSGGTCRMKHLGKNFFFFPGSKWAFGVWLFKHKWFTYRNLKERDCITLIKNVYLTGNRKNTTKVAELSFLWRVSVLTLRDGMRSPVISNRLRAKLLLLCIERNQSGWFRWWRLVGRPWRVNVSQLARRHLSSLGELKSLLKQLPAWPGLKWAVENWMAGCLSK